MSLNTVQRMFNAPNRRNTASKLYKNLVPAKVAIKSNTLGREHTDGHYCRGQVRMALELINDYRDEVIGVSADAKAKMNLSGAVVSRMVKANCFMLTSDVIKLPDHDFPEPGYKITPMGYMRLQPTFNFKHKRTKSLSPTRRSPSTNFRDDTALRSRRCADKSSLPRTGPLQLYLRGQMFHRENAYTHYCDLMRYLKPLVTAENKKAVVLLSDNGPDWSKASVKTQVAMGMLWEELNLDYLLVTSYAPGDNHYNPIEHAWAPITMWCLGLVLQCTLEGEDVCPNRQTISAEERDSKNARVFDTAMEKIKSVLDGRTYDGHPVNVYPISSLSENNKAIVNGMDELAKLTSKKGLRDSSDHVKRLAEKYKFYAEHCRQGTYTLEYTRCNDFGIVTALRRPLAEH